MAGRFLSLCKVFRRGKKKGPGAAPAQQPEEPEQSQTLQDDAALDRTQEREPTRGRFHRTLKMFRRFLRIRRRKTSVNEDVAITSTKTRETQGLTNTGTTPAPTMIPAPTMDFFKETAVPPQQRVPAKVKDIHQSLLSHVSADARLQRDIVRLAEEHPADVVLTLLRCAPTCDRAAAMMWRAIASSGPAVEKVLPTLLCVMENWPQHRMCTSDGDNEAVFALAATLVIWVIVPVYNKATIPFTGRLFVALLFHVAITTQQMPPEEVANFWRACREEQRLPSKPNRFAVQAMKALLYRLPSDKVVMAMERKRGWDTLLRAHTQHYAVGLLAREMRRVSILFCSCIAPHVLWHLSREEPCWDLPALAFLVEVLDCLDLSKCGGSVLNIMSGHLQSECSQRRRLALRGLVVPSKDPSMAGRMCSLSCSLLELLRDADGEVVSMSLRVLTNVLPHHGILRSSIIAPKLAEVLLLLFDHKNSHVQLLCIQLFCKLMELVVDEGKKPLKTIVNKSLYTLLIYCHDDNWHVAKASRETLHCAAKFLMRRDLEQLVEKEQLSKFVKCLLAEDGSRAAEHLRPNTEIHAKLALRAEELGSSSGSRQSVSQEQHQETLKSTSPLSAARAPGRADAGHNSCGFSPLPAST
ncbi:uncharacterized protein LOC128791870 [Vidua chalybeata]|uniref:uncharacterized protein LOC128791869 n=1 Tax=Vidua chalybeata TaxID=81927 RepID=UPI0023A8584A|nr:uncharacterized protein LOC128791869 [Vidua chalybeata]XP_053805761.1 uncharacterized protein LOC128791870 [Vidua chalybeata]